MELSEAINGFYYSESDLPFILAILTIADNDNKCVKQMLDFCKNENCDLLDLSTLDKTEIKEVYRKVEKSDYFVCQYNALKEEEIILSYNLETQEFIKFVYKKKRIRKEDFVNYYLYLFRKLRLKLSTITTVNNGILITGKK